MQIYGIIAYINNDNHIPNTPESHLSLIEAPNHISLKFVATLGGQGQGEEVGE